MDADAFGLLKNKVALVVNSCDAYSDAWSFFNFYFNRYWPDCPFPIYFLSNTLINDNKQFISLTTNQYTNWSQEIKAGLNQINCEYFIYLQEDYFLTQKINNEIIIDIASYAVKEKIDYLGLIKKTKNTIPFNKKVNVIETQSIYCTNLQAALWNKVAFLSLLNPAENAWDFEMNSIKRSQHLKLFNVTTDFITILYPEYTAIYKGKWTNPAVKILKQNGFFIDTNTRKIENFLESIKRKYYEKMPVFLRHTLDWLIKKYQFN